MVCPQCPVVKVRLNGTVADYNLSGKESGLPKEIESLILTVLRDYSYLL